MLTLLPASRSSAKFRSTSLPDLSLERVVRDAIRRRCERCFHGMAVWVEDGVVTLRGQTRSFYEKQLVLHAAQQVSGVREIVDEVIVAVR